MHWLSFSPKGAWEQLIRLLALIHIVAQGPYLEKVQCSIINFAAIPAGSRLDTIIEESEYSRSSSFSKKQHEAGAFSFSNKSALEDLEHELQTTAETQLKDLPNEPAGEDLFIANEHALSLEKSGKTLEEDFADGIPKRGSAITTSFKKVVPMRNISENGGKPKIQPNDSPLLRYAPRGTAIPPSEVKGGAEIRHVAIVDASFLMCPVPFSEDVAESKTTAVAGMYLIHWQLHEIIYFLYNYRH